MARHSTAQLLTTSLLQILIWFAHSGNTKVNGFERRIFIFIQEQQIVGLDVPYDDVTAVGLC